MLNLGLRLGLERGGAAVVIPPPSVPSSLQFNGVDERVDILPNTIGSSAGIGWALSLWLKMPSTVAASGKIVYGETGNSHNMAVNAAAAPYPLRRRLNGSSVSLTTTVPANTWSHLVWQSNCTGSYATWATSTAYNVGDKKRANSNIYTCTQSGTSAGSGTGPSGTGTGIADGTCIWDFRNSDSLTYFINGVKQATSSSNVNFFFDNFGSRSGGSNTYQGQMCEATVWNEALPDSVWVALYNGGVFTDPLGPSFAAYSKLNHWRMGLGDSAASILDLVGAKNLTPVNMDNGNFVPDHP